MILRMNFCSETIYKMKSSSSGVSVKEDFFCFAETEMCKKEIKRDNKDSGKNVVMIWRGHDGN